MKTLTCWIIVLGVTIFAYLSAFVWMFYKTIAKWIRKNDELVADDWEDTDNNSSHRIGIDWGYTHHHLCNGKHCICNEPYGDTETITEINHNLRNNR